MMNDLAQNFSSVWLQALGYTLLHSLWQSLIIMAIVVIMLRAIPSRHSTIRYTIAVTGMLTMLLSATTTFIYLTITLTPSAIVHTISLSGAGHIQDFNPQATGWLDWLQALIKNNIPLIVFGWSIGATLFILRCVGSMWYVGKLKREATLLQGEWYEKLSKLTAQLHIQRIVNLAESTHISAPAVIGYVKPMILIPAGMLSGLSTAQIEAIFIHELTHIRRHDYLINLLQSFTEAIFFFNPFVWMVSNIIRREREHCCDDAVIAHSGNAKEYVYALAHLEEERLSKYGVAVSLANQKTELLNRIKRIMEKSVKHYTVRERVIPAILLVAGLLCASWLTVQSRQSADEPSYKEDNTLLQDTTKKKKEKSATYSRKKTITSGPDGKPHEEIVENFEGDESLRPLMEEGFNFSEGPWMDMEIMIPPFPPFDNFNFSFDSLNEHTMVFRNHQGWEEFTKEFQKSFQENFGDFYKKHQHEFDNMMLDIQKNMEGNFDEEWTREMHEHAQRQAEQAQRLLEQMDFNKDHMKIQQEQLRKIEEGMRKLEFNDDHFKEAEEKMKALEQNMKKFELELKDELQKDGYLKKGEKIERMSWDEDGSIEINGKKIKDNHSDKYQQLHRKYFKGGGNFRYVE